MNAARIPHAPMVQFPVTNDCLHVGGVPLTELAQRAGRTPFYVYDSANITQRVAALRKHLPPQIQLHYAIKANPLPALVRHLAALVDGLDVASGGELGVALASGMAAARISFAGPGKSNSELEASIAADIVVNLESEREMERIAALAAATGKRPSVAIRVNPDFELKNSGMRMSGGPKQFGVDAERVPAMLARMRSLPLAFKGFHIFSGSQNLNADAIGEAQHRSVELALRLAQHAPTPVRLLNIGGGFGIPYFPGEKPLDLARVGSRLAEIVSGLDRKLPHAEVVVELGRYLVGEAGLYVCRIIERKVSRGHAFLITDGGLHHHLAASGNFGQVIRKNYPVVVGNRVTGQEREVVSVVGPLCTPLDLLADSMELAKADEGDLIAVFQSGAYGRTASPTAFLSHPEPIEIFV